MDSIREVYTKGLCTGCGTCASACPTSAIEIVKDEGKGIYVPQIDDTLCNQCGICLEVCPGLSVDFNELNLKIFGKEPAEPWLGNHIGLYIGHAADNELRLKSSSGGLITALLVFALEEKLIDGAIVTRMNRNRPLEPEVIVARTREEIISARGSKYCPVPANMKLGQLVDEEGKFAIVGLPCHMHGLRKFEAVNQDIRDKVVLRLGLMCSSNATLLGTEYFLKKHGIRQADVKRLDYRGEGWLSDYNIVVHLKSGSEKVIPRRGIVFDSSFHRDFAMPRCLLCCDQSCEFADISFGDPRLPDLMKDKLGKSLIVSRTPLGEEILKKASAKGAIELTGKINVPRFFQGQNISFKRGFRARLSLLKAFGRPVPNYETAKLAQSSDFTDYLGFLFCLPSYATHKRYLWPLIYPGSIFRGYFQMAIAKLAALKRRISGPRKKEIGKRTKVFLMGASLTKNLGGPSLLISSCKILKAHIPDVEFTLWSPTPKRDADRAKEYGVRIIGTERRELIDAFLRCLLWSALRELGLNIPSLLGKNKLLKEYRAADAFIDIWGISFTDFFSSWRGNIVAGMRLLTGKLLGKPVVKFSQDMGPFRKKATRYPAKFFLNRIDLIIARSKATQNHLKSIAITRQVQVRPDSAFVLDPAPRKRIDDILQREKLNRRPLIAITPTTQIDRRLSDGNLEAQNKYTIMLAQIADHLIETLKAVVVFIPNEIPGGYDDVYVIEKIQAKLKNKSDVRLITAEYTAEELKGLIGACDLLIGSRYHSVIAATSMCVPTMVIGWGHKYNELMKTVGLADFECDFQSVTYKELQAKTARLWRNREKIRAELTLKIPGIKESVMSGGKLVKDLIDTYDQE
jgi:coenzyme F420 hydrogenase subunit beta